MDKEGPFSDMVEIMCPSDLDGVPVIRNLREASSRENGFGASDIRVDRKTKWGNPFRIGNDGDREEVIKKHRRWLLERCAEGFFSRKEMAQFVSAGALWCWCAPQDCHAINLLEVGYAAAVFDSEEKFISWCRERIYPV